MGELNISGERRKKDEPFNPFARDASAQRNKRMSERSQNQRRNAPAQRPTSRPQQDPKTAHNELAKRRQEALNRLGSQDSKPAVEEVKKPNEPVVCLLYTSPSPRDATLSRMPSSA